MISFELVTVVTQPAEATEETDKEGITQTRFKGKRKMKTGQNKPRNNKKVTHHL
jgi:hypothetical protein